MPRTHALQRQLLLAVTVTLVACSIDGTTPPPQPDISMVGRAALAAGDQSRLDAELEREKQRIAAALEASKPMYDSLKIVWDRYLSSAANRQSTPFLICDPLQYVANTKIVGPEGADLDFGPHKLSIPARALNSYVVVTAEAPTSLKVEATFRPHGLVFNSRRQPTLTLSYKHCDGLQLVPSRIVYVDDWYRIIEYPLSRRIASEGLVQAWIKHFSSYVVAY